MLIGPEQTKAQIVAPTALGEPAAFGATKVGWEEVAAAAAGHPAGPALCIYGIITAMFLIGNT